MAVVTVNESVTTGTAGLKLGAYAVQRFLRGGSMTSAERTAALALMGDGVDLITYHWSGGYSNATPATQQLGTSDFAPTSMATARDYATHGSKLGLDAAFANLDALIALRPAAKVAIVMFDHPQAMLNGATRTTSSNFPWPASTYWGGSYAGTLCDNLITRYGSKILAFSYGQELKGLTNRTDTTQLDSFAAGYTAWATYMRGAHPTVELWYPHLNYFATASLASRQAAVDALIAGGSTLQAADETIINRLMDDVSPTLVDRMTYDVSIVDYNSADTWRNSYAAVASRTTLEYHLQRVLKAKMTSRWSSVKPLVAIESYFNVNQTLEVLDSGVPITPNQQAALATAILIAAQKGGVTYHNRWEPQGGDPGAEAPDGNIASWWDRDGVATPAWYQARDLITAIPAGSTLYTVSSSDSNLTVASGGNNVYILNTSGAAISASVTATSGSLVATSIPAYGYTVRKLPSGSGVPPTPVPPPTDPAPTTDPITYPKNRHHNRMWHIGLVPTDQLGTGTADSTTVLYGDNTWGVPSSSALPWFTVTDYGAVGDGSTDDTAAVNLAIDALNTATQGVLYFPAGSYKVTSALTTITASGMALGDGMASFDNAVGGSRINFTSQTAVLFTVSAKAFRFAGLGFVNTYAGTPSAGAAILVDSSYLEQRVDYEACSFQGFYDNVDVKVGAQWSMRGCFVIAPVRYGVRVRNTVNNDAGDWAISDTNFSAQTYNSTSAVRVESAGGGKILGCKINMALDSKRFATGIDVTIASGVATTVLAIVGNSIENVSGDAIGVTTTGTGHFGLFTVTGNQVGLYTNNSGRAVNLTAASNGVLGANGAIAGVVIDGLIAHTDGTARAAINLTNTDRVTLGDIQLSGFNARYTSSGDTNTTDGSSAAFATPAIVLGTAGAAGAATTIIRSDSTIAAFDSSVPVTQTFSDTAATGSAAFAARRDHKHGMPATPALTAGLLLIADTHSTPLVFADLLQSDAQDDMLYAD